ncbi:MAG: GGDEF domain-containing protein, partial [Rhodospirillales bacterium]|nr:GGDEF domain-containing protein [Rhodospirillales bacterium]
RWGGDEFVMLLPDCDLQHAARIAEELRKAIAEHPVIFAGAPIPVTISLGVAQLGERENEEDLILRADRALYTAKQAGRNRVHIAS